MTERHINLKKVSTTEGGVVQFGLNEKIILLLLLSDVI